MKKKRILAMILAVASCLSLAVSASAAGTTTHKATDFKDYDRTAWYLAEVVKQNTRAYAADFDYDAKRLWDSAQETDMERRSFLWMSRLHGTWCVSEREVFLDDTNANCIWTHYADCPEGILAYRIVVEGIRDGKLAGKVITIDYAKQVRRVMQSALPIAKIQ